MQKSYWEARWRKNKIGFHGSQPDEALTTHWPDLNLDSDSIVAAPLCGKSTDLVWLRNRGHEVYGVEFVEQACRDFFEEQGMGDALRVRNHPKGPVYSSDGITLQAADFMKLHPRDVPAATALYDRAALVALPEEMRADYAARCSRLFPELDTVLLVSFEYDSSLMSGPPFSIYGDEIRRLYGETFTVKELSRTDMVPVSEKYRRIGLPEMIKVCWLLKKKT